MKYVANSHRQDLLVPLRQGFCRSEMRKHGKELTAPQNSTCTSASFSSGVVPFGSFTYWRLKRELLREWVERATSLNSLALTLCRILL